MAEYDDNKWLNHHNVFKSTYLDDVGLTRDTKSTKGSLSAINVGDFDASVRYIISPSANGCIFTHVLQPCARQAGLLSSLTCSSR